MELVKICKNKIFKNKFEKYKTNSTVEKKIEKVILKLGKLI